MLRVAGDQPPPETPGRPLSPRGRQIGSNRLSALPIRGRCVSGLQRLRCDPRGALGSRQCSVSSALVPEAHVAGRSPCWRNTPTRT